MTANWTQEDVNAFNERRKPPEQKAAEKLARTDKADAGLEKILQQNAENFLGLRGYRHRTPDDIMGSDGSERGYVIHLNETKRNPILLDILILGADGRYIEIELKSASGRLSDEQARIIMHSENAFLVNRFELFMEIVKRWEEMSETKQRD